MKTAEKLAAGWLLTLGFMFLTQSVCAVVEKSKIFQDISSGDDTHLVVDIPNVEAANYLDAVAKDSFIFGVPTMVLGGWLSLSLYRQSKKEQKALQQQTSDRLQSTFYQMLQQNNGRVTVLGFAMQSQLPAPVAREFLDEKAKEFNANFKVTEEGAVSYHFDI
ncbi:hypothetical protein H6G76_16305 [Nostoc sp. FACHB-152]|uniref:hypothetical protein n=1 Tax=unclassified Nostoc TaxID=2593658 RepID=UPI001684B357|nr:MULTISPECIES: hypothetical protein [unclassified Nostoc]MBD2448686.1 hypothetical protein [Nostoc sp. FACHB-152]MBD2468329.1 hypothetical protein [Nostoc sp. FACHB-145]